MMLSMEKKREYYWRILVRRTAPTTSAVRRFLKEFLWDPRVVNLPRPLWWVILHFFVLPFRPHKSAKAYRKIWDENGSPLAFWTLQLTRASRR